MPSHYGGITPQGLVSRIRSSNPGVFDELSDTQLFKYILEKEPSWSKHLSAGSATSLSPLQSPQQAAVFGSTGHSREAGPAGFFKQLAHNTRRHAEEVPAMAAGMLGWLSQDPVQKSILIKEAESWRDWSENQLYNQLKEDPELLAHYQWVKDTPFSFDNLFSSTGFDLVKRGIASGLPSILEMIALSKGTGLVMRATGLAAKGGLAARMSPRIVTMLGMSGLEGSSFYNEGMRNLVDEGGMTPEEALDEIGPLTAVVAPLIGISEYLPFGKVLNKMGMQKLSEKQLMKAMASRMNKGFAKRVGKQAAIGWIAEGSQEWGQGMIQKMGEHSYMNGYGNSPIEALSNFWSVLSDNWATPEAKEEFFVGSLMGTIMRGAGSAASLPTPRRVAKLLNTQQKNVDASVRLGKYTEAQGKELSKGYKALVVMTAVKDMDSNGKNEFANQVDSEIANLAEKGTLLEKAAGVIEKVKSIIPSRKKEAAPLEEAIDYTQYKVPELRQMAKDAGITGTSNYRKQDLIDALESVEKKEAPSPFDEVLEDDVVQLKDKDLRGLYISSIADDTITDFLDSADLRGGVLGPTIADDAKITKPSMKLLSLISKDRGALDEILAHPKKGKLLMLAGDAMNESEQFNIDLKNENEIISKLREFSLRGRIRQTEERIIPGELGQDEITGGEFVPEMGEIPPQDTPVEGEIPPQEEEIGGTKSKEEIEAEDKRIEEELLKHKRKYPAPAWEVGDIVQLDPKVKRKTGLSPDVDYKVVRRTDKMVFVKRIDGKGAQIGVYKNQVVGERKIEEAPESVDGYIKVEEGDYNFDTKQGLLHPPNRADLYEKGYVWIKKAKAPHEESPIEGIEAISWMKGKAKELFLSLPRTFTSPVDIQEKGIDIRPGIEYTLSLDEDLATGGTEIIYRSPPPGGNAMWATVEEGEDASNIEELQFLKEGLSKVFAQQGTSPETGPVGKTVTFFSQTTEGVSWSDRKQGKTKEVKETGTITAVTGKNIEGEDLYTIETKSTTHKGVGAARVTFVEDIISEKEKKTSRETVAQRKKRLEKEMNAQNQSPPNLDIDENTSETISDNDIPFQEDEIPSNLDDGSIKSNIKVHMALFDAVGNVIDNEIGLTAKDYDKWKNTELQSKDNVINDIVARVQGQSQEQIQDDKNSSTNNEIEGDTAESEPKEQNIDDDVQNLLQEIGVGKTPLLTDEPKTAKKLAQRLHKKFGKKLGISVETFEGVINVNGVDAVGTASLNLVKWSLTDGRLDTLPHEYAHIYVKLLGDTNIIKLGIKKFTDKGMSPEKAEEALVQHIGEYYVEQMDKSLVGRFKVWLKQFVNRLKNNIFGGADKKTKAEIGDFIAEMFYVSEGLERAGVIKDFVATQKLSEDADDTSTATMFNQIPSDIHRMETYNRILNIYIEDKDFAQVGEIAKRTRTHQDFTKKLMIWAKNYAKKRPDRAKNLKRELSVKDKERLKIDWLKMKSRINRFIGGKEGKKRRRNGQDTRPILMFTFDTKNGNSIKMAPITHPVTGKTESESFTMNFFEQHFLQNLHDMRLIPLPVRNLIKHVEYYDKTSKSYKSFDTWYNLEITEKTIREMDNVSAENFIAKVISSNNMEKTAREQAFLTTVGSKVGDNAAIFFVSIPNEYKSVTKQEFKDFIKEELDKGHFGPPKSKSAKDKANEFYKSGTSAIKDKQSWNKYLDMTLDEIKAEVLNDFASDKGVARAERLKRSGESAEDALTRLMMKDLKQKLAFRLRRTAHMSRAIGVHKWWQAAETSDYLAYQKSVADAYDRLSIPMAEGFNPYGMRDTKFMHIDDDVKMTVTIDGEEKPAGEYKSGDGHLLTSGRWFNDLSKKTGVPLRQLKTFINHKDYQENGDSYDLAQMKHMQFAPFKNMKFYNNSGELIAMSRRGGRSNYFIDMRQSSPTFGQQFDIIGSGNEIKRARGKYSEKYVVHSIPYTSVKVHTMMPYNAPTGAHPFAFGELLLNPSLKDTPVVKNLIKEIRKNYGVDEISNADNVADRYINQMLTLRDNPKALLDFVTRERDKSEDRVETDLDKLLKSVDKKTGDGIHHPTILLQIIPMINSSLVRDGLFKGRSAEGNSTRLYLRPQYHLEIDEGLGFVGSDDDSFTFNKAKKAYVDWWNDNLRQKGEGKRTVKGWNKEKHDWVKTVNSWLEEKDAKGEYKNNIWFLIHRQPIQKAGGVILRRVQRIQEGGLGKTSMLSEGDVKWLLDGDWDGDTVFLEDIADGYANAMLAWQNSKEYQEQNQSVYLELFSNRVDKPTNEEDKTSMASYSDRVKVMASVAKGQGGTGLTTNAKVIFMQLASKGLKIYPAKDDMEGVYFETYSPDDSIVLDYMPLDKNNLVTPEAMKNIKDNGDSVVYFDTDGNQHTVDMSNIKQSIEKLKDVNLYLKTTKQHEFNILFQMAVDSNKYSLWGGLKWNKGDVARVGGDRDFITSRMWKRSDGKSLSTEALSNDYATLSVIQSIQNISKIRQGKDNVGSASFNQNLEASQTVANRYYDRETGNKFTNEEIGQNYVEDFGEKVMKYGAFDGWGIRKIETNGFVTPGEELISSIGRKWLEIDRDSSMGDENSKWGASFMVHSDNFLRLAHVEAFNGMMKSINKTVMGANLQTKEDAMQFLTKEREFQVEEKVLNKETKEHEMQMVTKKMSFFQQFELNYAEWDKQRKSSELGVVKMDYSTPFIEFRERHISEYMSLPSLTKAWVSLHFLSGIGKDMFLTRLLPTDFMDEGILKRFLKSYEKALKGFTGAEKGYGENQTGAFRLDVVKDPKKWGGYVKYNTELNIITQQRVKEDKKKDNKTGICKDGN